MRNLHNIELTFVQPKKHIDYRQVQHMVEILTEVRLQQMISIQEGEINLYLDPPTGSICLLVVASDGQ